MPGPDDSPVHGRAPLLIDLHMHTSASDGADDPVALVASCAAAGLSVIAITDHDTVDALPAAADAARRAGLGFVPGIELTAAWRQKDVHVLGYFVDHGVPALIAFLARQREDRIRRAREMGPKLAAMGVPIDIEDVIESSGTHPVSRPSIARAMVEAGHVSDEREAFDRYVGEGRPGYAPRAGVTIEDAIRIIGKAGGIASLAHPGLTRIDELIPGLRGAGLGAIEVYHPDHDEALAGRYLALARGLGLGVTGGTDYHGIVNPHRSALGRHVTPAGDFEDLCRRAGRRPPEP